MIPTVPLVAHFVDNEGKRVSSLRVVAIGDQGACFVLWQNRLTAAPTINDPTHKFDRLEYGESEPAVRAEPSTLNVLNVKSDTRDKTPKTKGEPEVK